MDLKLNDPLVFMALAIFLSTLAYLLARAPLVVFGFFVIWFAFVWRSISIVYLDVWGPVYAYQIHRDVGGGSYSIVLITAFGMTLLPFGLILGGRAVAEFGMLANRLQEREARRERPAFNLADLATILMFGYLGLLLALLVSGGSIPLLEGVEQQQFKGESANRPHSLFMTYHMLFAFAIGSLFAHHHIRTRRFHRGLLAVFAADLAYALLTGHRFSFFYAHGSMFVAPLAASVGVWMARSAGSDRPFGWVTAAFNLRQIGICLAGLSLVGLVVFAALVNSYFNIRFADAESSQYALFQRILVQPTEITWASFQRVFEFGNYDGWTTARFLFDDPIDPSRQSTIQYLMLRTVGSVVTYDHLSQGVNFAGGFPEILFELFGPILAWPAILLLGWISAVILGIVLRAIVLGQFLTVFLGIYVLFGFIVMYIGGMLNFAMQWTYYIKVAAFCIGILMDTLAGRQGVSLIPWHLGNWRDVPRQLASTVRGAVSRT